MSAPALLTALECVGHVHLIIGSGPLAASRASKSIEVGASPIVITPPGSDVHYTLAKRIEEGTVNLIQKDFEDNDLKTLGRPEVDNVVDAVFVTTGPRSTLSTHISTLCRRLRIPVNVTDAPNLCTFTLLSTHTDGPLQIGITTSGKGCKLSSRIRREIAASLPPNFGQTVERLGTIRRRIWEEDHAAELASDPTPEIEDEETPNQKHTFNTLIQPSDTSPSISRTRRLRWLSQICEYWPLRRLSSISDSDISSILSAYTNSTIDTAPLTLHTLDSRTNAPHHRGTITLAGSGPGHPDLLTRATYTAIQSSTFILADKLVPAPVLDLIPRRTPVHIARKFPGNADAAQEELLSLGLAALKRGEHVLRLKQGDPYLYGRGAEELDFFRKKGYQVTVLPGVTSALSAPLFARIPVTHRSVADQVLICTGTGRKGASPDPPGYNRSLTVVFLMALHRLESLVGSLTARSENAEAGESESESAAAKKPLWPREIPCAVVERASCPDQRVIRSTLEHVCKAVEEEGSRPPGLLVLGWSCEVLCQSGGQRWVVEEGFRGLDGLLGAEGDGGFDVVTEMGRSRMRESKEEEEGGDGRPGVTFRKGVRKREGSGIAV
jgi:uroporphyrin-III C-methyltransferase